MSHSSATPSRSASSWRAAAIAALVVATASCGSAEPAGEDNDVLEAAAASFAVGVSDSDPETFTHPKWADLKVKRARVVVPWDVAKRPANDERRLQFEAWLAAAKTAGVEPYATIGPSKLMKSATGKYLAPTAQQYEDAFIAFRATYPSIKLVGAWNEPNYPDTVLMSGVPLDKAGCKKESLDACGPMLAAFYYRLVKKHCQGCTVVAGEFDSTPNDKKYWSQYKKFLRSHRPKVWSIHPHHDANRFQAAGKDCPPGDNGCTTRLFVKWLGGLGKSWQKSHVWLTEVGAYRRNADGKVFSEASQLEATKFILRLPKISPRITRIYYYNFQNSCSGPGKCPVQDRGLVSPPEDLAYDKPNDARSSFVAIRNRDASP